jgi:hypothetical protein
MTLAPGQLTPKQLAAANAAAMKRPAPSGQHIIREPAHNTYGRIKVLRRTDGLFVLHELHEIGRPGSGAHGAVFREEAARTAANGEVAPEATIEREQGVRATGQLRTPAGWDDTLLAWERRMHDVCRGRGNRSLDAAGRCTACGSVLKLRTTAETSA